MNAGGTVCSLMHKKTCPCAAYPTDADSQALDQYIPLYQSKLVELVNSGRYDTRDDFTVVIQPFLAHTQLPRTSDGQPDYSFFAPDCFHFSGLSSNIFYFCFFNNILNI
jgi:phospholipase B1